MTKPRSDRLPPVPRRQKRKPPAAAESTPPGSAADAGPDLSHIAEPLRQLAVPVGELLFDPANARIHNEPNIEAVKGSLAVYGQVKPVVVRKDTGVVIAGNGTLKAALLLGWSHLAAVYVEMDAATAAGYSVADNRTSELGSWDKDALDKLLRECSTANDERLDAMLASLSAEVGIVPQEAVDQQKKQENQEKSTTEMCSQCGRPLK